MQDAHLCSYEQHVLVHKHIYAYKFIMITFPEKLFYEYLHLHSLNIFSIVELHVKHIPS